MANTTPPPVATAASAGFVVVPVTLYVVAALFFAKGLFFLIWTIGEAYNTRVMDIGGLLSAGVLMVIGWGLSHFGERLRRSASFVLGCGIVFRLFALVLLAFFLRDWLTGGISNETRAALQGKSGANFRWSYGVAKIISISASPKTGWYLVRDGKERVLRPVNALAVAVAIFLGIVLNLWQRCVLRHTDTLRVFLDINRANLTGQMSLARFLLLTAVFLSIHLAIWNAGFFI